MIRVYIAGPMTGLPEWNYPAFNDAADRLRSSGHAISVTNPADNFGKKTDLPRWRYISKSLDQIQGLAKIMYSTSDDCMLAVLPGWQGSPGACLEVETAFQLGLPVYDLECIMAPHWEEGCKLTPSQVSAWANCQTALKESEPKLADWEVEAAQPESKRAAILAEAIKLITGDRNVQYGPPGKDFNRAANALTALGFGKENAVNNECEVLADHDVAIIMIVLKLSRLMWSPQKRDSWVDVAGYAGCGGEVARAE